jgi:Periplasmic copper-binding protein (NosD)
MRLSWPQRRAHQKSRPPIDRRRPSLRFFPRLEVLEQRLAPAAFVVNTSQDLDSGPAGMLSLREAINRANIAAGSSSISFAVNQVNVSSNLPEIVKPLAISGTGVTIAPVDPTHAPTIGLNFGSAGNQVSGLTVNGFGYQLAFGGGGNNVIEGNFIGTNPNGTAAVGGSGGISLISSSGNRIVGNVMSGLASTALAFSFGSNNNLVIGNFIGTDKSGSKALGNRSQGIQLYTSDGNTIGGTSASDRNVISGNAGNGIFIEASSRNLVEGNYIGTDGSGGQAIPNAEDGILVNNLGANPASGNTIGGTSAGAGNIMSGNSGDGVLLVGGLAEQNQVLGNYIGVNASDTAPLGNGLSGVEISDALMNTVGGTATGARNVISGNVTGIYIHSTAASLGAGNVIAGNSIGTDKGGTNALLGNKGSGVFIGSSGNTIGGTSVGAGNIISGNSGDGVFLDGESATKNQMQGNDIGLNASRTGPLPNLGNGVEILDAIMNTIGGTTAADRNIISANLGAGVYIHISAASLSAGNVIAGNSIGTDKAGTTAFGNKYGVFISGASKNSIGGTTPGAGNIIAFNQFTGVVVGASPTDQAVGNAIRQNSIFGNKRLGIDLGNNGVTLNHQGPPPAGPNQLQNHPVLASLTTTMTGTVAVFELRATPNTVYQLDFFSNTDPDPSWYGQGQTFLRSDTRTTDATGYVKFTEMFPVSNYVIATATDPKGNTSEFSSYVVVNSLEAFLDSTKNPVDGTSPPPGIFTTTNSALDFPTSTTSDMLVVVQNAGPIIVNTLELRAPVGAPIRWEIDRNPADVVATGLPTLSSQTATDITLNPNVPGSFRLICYLDADGDGKFQVGEELKVLRLVIVKLTIQRGASITQQNLGWGIPKLNGVSPTGLAMSFQASVLLEGGGPDERLGLVNMMGVDEVDLGDVGNIIGDSFSVSYPATAANPHAGTGTEDPDFKINPAPGFANPMLDTSRIAAGTTSTGGEAAFRYTSKDIPELPDPPKGLYRKVTSYDTPDVVWAYEHPTTLNPWSATSGNNSFNDYLVAFSQSFPRNYMVLGRGGYTITFAGTNVAGKWHNTGSSDVITNVTTAGFPKTGDASGVQVLGYSFVSEFGMRYTVPASNISGSASLSSLSTATGGVPPPALSISAAPLQPAPPGAAMNPAALSTGPVTDATSDIGSARVPVLRRFTILAKRPDRGAWDALDRFFVQDLLV